MKKISLIIGVLVIMAFGFVIWNRFSSRPNNAAGSSTPSQYGTATSSTAVGVSSSTATLIGSSGTTFYVTDITGSTDLSGAVLQVKDGSKVIWQALLGSSTPYRIDFVSPLRTTSGNSVSVTVQSLSTSTVGVSGYSIP